MLLKAIAIAMNFVAAFIGIVTAQKNYHHPKRKLFENFFKNRNYWFAGSMVLLFVGLNWWYALLMDDVEAQNKKEYAEELTKNVSIITDSAARQYQKVNNKFEKVNKELVAELRKIGYELDTAKLTIRRLEDKVNRPAVEVKPTVGFDYGRMKLTRTSPDSIVYQL